MSALRDLVIGWDQAIIGFGEQLRTAPLTFLFLLASAWWVKWPLFAVVGAARDVRLRSPMPRTALAAGMAAGLAGLAVAAVKDAVERARPPVADLTVTAVGSVPASYSFPSGHSATAFAAAVAIGTLCPRLRWPLLALATVVAVSRVYLGVHYATDVVVGSALGAMLGLLAAWIVRRVASTA